MKYIWIYVIAIAIIIFLATEISKDKIETPNSNLNQTKETSMLITSPSFNHNQNIPPKFTCDGGNHNPQLNISHVPADAKSLVLIMDDPDAPSGTFTHWLVWNIDPKTEVIKEESVPPGAVEGPNGASKIGYIGPCPPDGKPHRYFFKLYALGESLLVEELPNKTMLEAFIKDHLLEKAELIGTYER